jgi:hypothetical protein
VPTVASGSEAVVITGATGVGATVTVYARESDPRLLVAVIVNVAGPTVVGDPETTPEVASRVMPAGSAPADTVNVGAGYPVATTVELYAVPTVGLGSDAVVIHGASRTVTVYACASDPKMFVAVIVNVAGPAAVVTPDTAPVFASKLNPAGSAPAVTVYEGLGYPDA